MKGFMDFIREQGVVGLAVGFVLGGAVAKLVSSLVQDIINPVLGIFLGKAGNLADASFMIGGAEVMYGSFLVVCIDFIVVALVIYWGVKKLGLDKLDKKDN